MKWLITTFFILIMQFVMGQEYCENSPSSPTGLYVTDLSFNQTNATAKFNWTVVDSAYRYIISRKKLSDPDTEWQPIGAIDTIFSYENNRVFGGMDYLTTYVWRMKTFCGSGTQPQSDWSIIDTFSTLEFNPSSYSPLLHIELSNLNCESLTELTFTLEQDANEPDIASSAIFSSAGSFDFYSLNEGDLVGESYVMLGGGFYENNYILIVDEIIGVDKAIIAMENELGFTDAYFTIENENNGIKILNVSPNDGNSYTAGNYSEITFYNLFMNPPPGVLEFYSTIPSELNDVYNEQIDYNISCVSIDDYFSSIIYPNPNDGLLNIKLKGIKNVSLINITGQKIFDIITSNSKVDMSLIPSGVYFLEVKTETQFFQKKLIIR